MDVDAPNDESSPGASTALEDFARLALALSAAKAVHLEVLDETFLLGSLEDFAPSIALFEGGRLVLFGATTLEALEPLMRRLQAYVTERRGEEEHAAALAFAERANDIARSAARRFEALFEGLPVACYACDADGRLMEWNRAAEEIWPALAAAWCEDLAPTVDPDHPEAERAVLARALAGETVRSEEREVRVGSGELRWHLVSSFPLRDGAETIVGAIGARLDITRRKDAQRELAERESRFRTVLEALHEGLTVVDQAGHVVLRNESAGRILRQGTEERDLGEEFPLGSVFDADGETLPVDRWPLSIALSTGRPARDVVLGVSRPGVEERIWISVNAEPLFGLGGTAPIGAVATFTDVTARLRQDAQLADYATRLAAWDKS